MDLSKNPIIYITRDRERAEGVAENKYYSIASLDGSKDTLEILKESNISQDSSIIVFKNNIQIEELAKEKKLKLLNPSAIISEKIENKISQIEWLGDMRNLLPSHEIIEAGNIEWNKKPFVLQWAHGHTGDGTIFIQKEDDLEIIKEKFPDRQARITEYIKGPVFTVNIVANKKDILIGNINYQITGILPFTENPFSTIGNDWSLTYTLLTQAHIEKIDAVSKDIALKMQKENWKGIFGIDIIYDEEKDKIYLLEINARQTASVTYESQLQGKVRQRGVRGITIFEAHIEALLEKPFSSSLIDINDGAQIIKRVTVNYDNKPDTKKLEEAGYKIIKYNNTKINSDLIRIQSSRGIMEAHNKFNKRGKEILELL